MSTYLATLQAELLGLENELTDAVLAYGALKKTLRDASLENHFELKSSLSNPTNWTRIDRTLERRVKTAKKAVQALEAQITKTEQAIRKAKACPPLPL